MINLPDIAGVADRAELKTRLKLALERVDGTQLPLQRGLTRSSYTDGKNFSVTVLDVTPGEGKVHARVGIFYKGVVAGCNCADDPSGVPEIDEYCELDLQIDGTSGDAEVKLAD